MFRKRQKKQYPHGTFIPTPARICAIIQLSLAFIIIAWNLSQPFMGELFDYKSRLLLFYDVMGISPASEPSPDKQQRLSRNTARFSALSMEQQQRIIAEFELLKQKSQRTFLDKTQRSLNVLLYGIPPFEQAWLLLSIIIPILLLKRVEGAAHAIWLLPLITALYAWDNQRYGEMTSQSADSRLFPTEQELVSRHMNKPLSADIFEQKNELMHAWKKYLIQKWTQQTESDDSSSFERQAEDGEFAFNIARIEALSGSTRKTSYSFQKEPVPVLALYLFWNFFFAYGACRQIDREKQNQFAAMHSELSI